MNNREYRPTIAQLRTFATIAEHRHFGTAANRLGISQPSLSQALAALENGLGVQLIERSTRKVIVTAVGEELLPYAQATLDCLDAFVTHARGAHGGLVGPMNIGMIPTVAPFILPELLRTMPARTSDLSPRIIEEKTTHLTESLRQGTIDVAVVAAPADSPGFRTIELYREEFVLVLPDGHPMAGRRDVTVDELGSLELLLLDDGHCLRDQVLDLCRTVPMTNDPRRSATRAASLSTVVQCVAGGLGATLVPVSAVASECQRPGIALATFDHTGDPVGRTIALCYRTSSSRAEEFATVGEIITDAFTVSVDQSRVVLERFLTAAA